MQNILTIVLKYELIDILELIMLVWLVLNFCFQVVSIARLKKEATEFQQFVAAQSCGMLCLYIWIFFLR